ncbi:hypothetical protein LTR10_008168 [Elasticomyces elasticus]|nr:hypothetical protein LTR10_008168 [Elasticomyces elasticus]KAK4971982.1 hypothetical protein LTR42_006487 [Elasticomyces elasticus]
MPLAGLAAETSGLDLQSDNSSEAARRDRPSTVTGAVAFQGNMLTVSVPHYVGEWSVNEQVQGVRNVFTTHHAEDLTDLAMLKLFSYKTKAEKTVYTNETDKLMDIARRLDNPDHDDKARGFVKYLSLLYVDPIEHGDLGAFDCGIVLTPYYSCTLQRYFELNGHHGLPFFLGLLAQLAKAIYALHSVCKVHGSITMENIGIDHQGGRLCLLNLGFTRDVPPGGIPSRGIRTSHKERGDLPFEMHQMGGGATWGQPVDIWAFGFIVYRIKFRKARPSWITVDGTEAFTGGDNPPKNNLGHRTALDEFNGIVKGLQSYDKKTIGYIAGYALAKDQSVRPKAVNILTHSEKWMETPGQASARASKSRT